MDNTKERSIETFGLLENYELALSHLYRIYAEKLPEHAGFWKSLAREENSHAALLHKFKALMAEGKIPYRENSIEAHTVRQNLDFIKAHISFAESKDVNVKDSFLTAVEVESLLIEKNIFQIQDDYGQELKNLLGTLLSETKRHFEKLNEYVTNLRLKGERLP